MRSIVMFAHVFGTLMLFVTLAVEWFALALIRAAGEIMPPLLALHVLPLLPRFAGAAGLLILFSGIRLAPPGGMSRAPWMGVAVVALVIIGALAGTALRPLLRSLKDPPNSRDQAVAAWRQHASRLFVRASLQMRIAAALAVVYLMIAKPALAASALIVGLALIVGAVSGITRARA